MEYQNIFLYQYQGLLRDFGCDKMNHNERIKLVERRLADGKTDDEIVDEFRQLKLKDFNEKITRLNIAMLRHYLI